jgi:dihydrofolate reductase
MRLTLTTFLTVDGVMQAPGGPNEDPSDGFEHGGWLVPYADADMGHFMAEVFAEADAFLLGRRTYEIFAAHWPRVRDPDDPVASKLNSLPKFVASRSLDEVTWEGTTLIKGDVPDEVAELKRKPGRELQVHGSAALARTLMRHDLIDEYRLLTFPVMLGTGRRLFEDGFQAAALRLLHSRTTSSDVTICAYETVGKPAHGSFELDQ